MPVLKPLDPTIKVRVCPLEGADAAEDSNLLELVAVEAARSDKGLRARVDAVNGNVKASDLVSFAVAADRKRFAAQVEAATDRQAADVEAALIQLGQAIEIILRQSAPEPEEEEGDRENLSQQLVRYGEEATLFVNDRAEAFARFRVGQHLETWPLRSQAFKLWLTRQLYQDLQKAASSEAINAALNVLEGEAMFNGDGQRALGIRVAEENGSHWLDLADNDWRAIQITTEGWQIVREPPCLFRRYAPIAPQLEPQTGGTIDTLRRYLNLRGDTSDSAWALLVAWLVAAFLPHLAHPVLVVHGEQGSAKSTLLRLVCLLIDPSRTPLRSQPRDLGEWCQAADHAWLVCLDNLSTLPEWLSDAMCRAVYQEGFLKRKLFTDDEDILRSFRRVIALSGIEVVATRPDLLDRSLLLALEPIAPQNRRLESEVLEEFEHDLPAILGALLDLVCAVLRELPSVTMTHLPRMADFARIGVAVERVMGWEPNMFLKAYQSNVVAQHEEAISSSPVGEAILKFMEDRQEWDGTASELLAKLEESVSSGKPPPREWPKAPKALSGILKRLSPNLRAMGVEVKRDRSGKARKIYLTANATAQADRTGKSASFASPASSPSHGDDASPPASDANEGTVTQAVTHDDLDDANDATFQTLRGQAQNAWKCAGLEPSESLMQQLLGRSVALAACRREPQSGVSPTENASFRSIVSAFRSRRWVKKRATEPFEPWNEGNWPAIQPPTPA